MKRHRYRWKPWAGSLHLVSGTLAALFATAQTNDVAKTLAGQVYTDVGLGVILYIAFVIVGGFLLSILDDQ